MPIRGVSLSHALKLVTISQPNGAPAGFLSKVFGVLDRWHLLIFLKRDCLHFCDFCAYLCSAKAVFELIVCSSRAVTFSCPEADLVNIICLFLSVIVSVRSLFYD